MITDRLKLTIEIALYGMSNFHFTVSINSKSFPWAVRLVQGTYFPHFRQRSMSVGQTTYAAAAAYSFRHGRKAD